MNALKVLLFVALTAVVGRALVLDARKEPARRAHRTRVVRWAAERWVRWAYPGQRARYLWRPGYRVDVLLPGVAPFTLGCDVNEADPERVSCGLLGPASAASVPTPAAPHPVVVPVVAHPVVAAHR